MAPLRSAPLSDVEGDAAPPPTGNGEDMKSLGERIILAAALSGGATEEMVDVEWKADRIVVTIDVGKDENYQADIAADDAMGQFDDEDFAEVEWDEDEDEEIEYDDDVELELDEEFGEEEDFDPEALGLEEMPPAAPGQVNVPLIARTINAFLAQDGEDSPAFQIAKLHEIEVTTPEFDNVLRGARMFESYQGFDVTVEHWEEPKKKKQTKAKAGKNPAAGGAGEDAEAEVTEPKLKVTEGKLVGRDYDKDVTMVNVKGRVVKIKNDKIECVRLPKAKREKGVK